MTKKLEIGLLFILILFIINPIGYGCGEEQAAIPSPIDSDGDGWTDVEEQIAGTNPQQSDTDGDGYWDPLDPNPLDPKIPAPILTFTPTHTPTSTPILTPTPTPTLTITTAPTQTPSNCHTNPLWDWSYCSEGCKGNAGEGDCDTDSECSTGYCAKDAGAKYGQSKDMDICEYRISTPTPTLTITTPPTQTPSNCHTKPLWDWGYCSEGCKCNASEGDCDTDSECSTGYCAKGVGAKYGQSTDMDVCENRISTPTPTSIITTPPPAPTPVAVGSYENILMISATGYSGAVGMLRGEGYTVHNANMMTPELLAQYGVLFVGTRTNSFSTEEIALLIQWVKAGGSALFLVDANYGQNLNPILVPLYGISVNDDTVSDDHHYVPEPHCVCIKSGEIIAHPTTQNVQAVTFMLYPPGVNYAGPPSLTVTDEQTTVIVKGIEDAHSKYYTHSPPLAAVAEHRGGRVVVVTGKYVHPFQDGCASFPDNLLFLLNIANWLAHKT
jgi:hypothetical protein